MQWIFAVYGAIILFGLLVGAIGGGVWWAVTACAIVGTLAWFALDRVFKRKDPSGTSHTTGSA